MSTTLCSSSALSQPAVSGIDIRSFTVEPVTGYNSPFPAARPIANHGAVDIADETFCNVTIGYSFPDGGDDLIHLEIWLPWADDWNSRIMAVGGAGWAAGRDAEIYHHMAGAVSLGYATMSTDGSLENPWDPAAWALKEPGVIDTARLDDWGVRSLEHMSTMGKDIVAQFYGSPAAYAYFSGCSQGGRQGYELAQRYPDAFDGIAAAAPAIHLAEILMNWVWPHHNLAARGAWPRACELDALDYIAIDLCDAKDGIIDGLIADPGACDPFDPFEHVGAPAPGCEGGDATISEIAAFALNVTWSGIWDEQGQPLWPGAQIATDLSGVRTGGGLVMTDCSSGECVGIPLPLGPQWVSIFGMKDPAYDWQDLSDEDFLALFRDTSAEFYPYVGSSNPDLSGFKARGGKLLTFHGLTDQTIPAMITQNYFEKVKAADGSVNDYFRFFEVPGLAHCLGNGNPTTAFDALRSWVEDGTAPASLPVTYDLEDGGTSDRIVCPYPQKVKYDEECGDTTSRECFVCAACA